MVLNLAPALTTFSSMDVHVPGHGGTSCEIDSSTTEVGQDRNTVYRLSHLV